MTDPAAVAAGILNKMRSDDDNDKQAKKKAKKMKRKETMDALCVKKKKREEGKRKQFLSPKERVKFEGPVSLSLACEAAVRCCERAGVALPPSLFSDPHAQLPDPLWRPPPMVAPVEDDDDPLLMRWPEVNEPDPERAADNTLFAFYDDVEVVDPLPGEEKTLGWYCFCNSAEKKEEKATAPKNKKRVVISGKINIKKEDGN